MVTPAFTSWSNLHQPPKPKFPQHPRPNLVPVPNPSATNQPFKARQFKPIPFSFNLGSTSTASSTTSTNFNPTSTSNPSSTSTKFNPSSNPPSDRSSSSTTSANLNPSSTHISNILDRIKQGAPLPPRTASAPTVHPWRRINLDLTNSQTRTDLSQTFNIVRTIPFDDILFPSPPPPVVNTTSKGNGLEVQISEEVREYDPSHPYFSPFKSSAKRDIPPHQMTPFGLRQVIVPDTTSASKPAPNQSETRGKKKSPITLATKKKSKIATQQNVNSNKSSNIQLSKKVDLKKNNFRQGETTRSFGDTLNLNVPGKTPKSVLKEHHEQLRAARKRGMTLGDYLKMKRGQKQTSEGVRDFQLFERNVRLIEKQGEYERSMANRSNVDEDDDGRSTGANKNENENTSKLDSFLKMIQLDPEVQDIFTHHTSPTTTAALENNAKFRLYKRLGEIVDRF